MKAKNFIAKRQGGGETVVFLQNCNNTLAHTLFDIAWQQLSLIKRYEIDTARLEIVAQNVNFKKKETRARAYESG